MARGRIATWWSDLWSTRWKLLFFILLNVLLSQANLYAGVYVDEVPSATSSDLILDTIPARSLDFLFIYFFLFTINLIYIYPLIFEPKRFYYCLGLITMIYFTRTIFIMLTHLQVDPACIVPAYPGIYEPLAFKNDLFFSGHTAFPFLGFLMFRNRYAKAFFLIASLVLGATVLLTHCHYSIDVFAAFFITYGVYVLGNKLFMKVGWMPRDEQKK